MTEPDYAGLRDIQAKTFLFQRLAQRHRHEHELIHRALRRLAGQPHEIMREAHKLAKAAYTAMRKEMSKEIPDPLDDTPEVEQLEEFVRDAVSGRLQRPERELIRDPDGRATHVRSKDGISPIMRGPDGRPTGLGRAIPIAGASYARRA